MSSSLFSPFSDSSFLLPADEDIHKVLPDRRQSRDSPFVGSFPSKIPLSQQLLYAQIATSKTCKSLSKSSFPVYKYFLSTTFIVIDSHGQSLTLSLILESKHHHLRCNPIAFGTSCLYDLLSVVRCQPCEQFEFDLFKDWLSLSSPVGSARDRWNNSHCVHTPGLSPPSRCGRSSFYSSWRCRIGL